MPTSSGAMMWTMVSECRAAASRSRSARGEHLGGVLQHAGASHGVAGRRRDGEVDVAVLQVELAVAQVLRGVPAGDVVVHGHARIPLGDLVQPALGEVLASGAALPCAGPCGARRCRADRRSGRQRPVEVHPHHRRVDPVVERGRGRLRRRAARPARRRRDPARSRRRSRNRRRPNPPSRARRTCCRAPGCSGRAASTRTAGCPGSCWCSGSSLRRAPYSVPVSSVARMM